MTYQELIHELQNLTKEQLTEEVTVFIPDVEDEYHQIKSLCVAVGGYSFSPIDTLVLSTEATP